jgi:hypothetical protein
LLNEEARQGIPTTDSAPVALAATRTRTKTPLSEITCFKCHKKGHYQSHCPENDSLAAFAGLATENLAF